MVRILLVDDEQAVLDGLCRNIRRVRPDWQLDTITNPETALKALRGNTYHVIVSDYSMAPIDGVVFLKESRVYQNQAKRIILSGKGSVDTVIDAVNEAEIFRYLLKPVSTSELVFAIDQAIDYQKITAENERLANTVRRLKTVHSEVLSSLTKMSGQHAELQEIIGILKQV